LTYYVRQAIIFDSDGDMLIPRRVTIIPFRTIIYGFLCLISSAIVILSFALSFFRYFSAENNSGLSADAIYELLGTTGFTVVSRSDTTETPDHSDLLGDSKNISDYLNYLYPSITENTITSESENKSENTEYHTQPSGKTYPIVSKNLASYADDSLGISITNETSYSPDIHSLLTADSPIEAVTSCFSPEYASEKYMPIVLILHTHGTEAYSPENTDYYNSNENFRSEDPQNNIVAVGDIITRTLISHGIPTVHCDIMHDQESYTAAYSNAADTIEYYLDKYPTIKYIFDVHRDSIIYSDGTAVKPTTEINGSPSAQVMTVVGTDEMGANHPNWSDNLNIAVKLQYIMNSEHKALARPINLRGAGFNEQYTKGSLILEIGSCANTLSEAKTAGKITAECIAKLILGQSPTAK